MNLEIAVIKSTKLQPFYLQSFRLRVDSPASKLAYIEVDSPTRSELIRLYRSRFSYTEHLFKKRANKPETHKRDEFM